MVLIEGVKVPADGRIINTNSIRINESTLTGESVGVNKIIYDVNNESDTNFRLDYCYAGTLVIHGRALVLVTEIGNNTEYGKIGKNINEIVKTKNSLEKQTSSLIKITTIMAFIFCVLVFILTYFNISDYPFKERIIESILSGITVAMTMIPEEYPVVLTVFLSMGAWRLAKRIL